MRLLNFGAGEIADRLTILSLKLHHAEAAAKSLDHFRNEQQALLVKLKAGNGIAVYVEELLELAMVNGRLWDAEDEIREHRRTHAEVVARPEELQQLVEAVRCAFRIQSLNDRRAALVEAINQKTGEHIGREKL